MMRALLRSSSQLRGIIGDSGVSSSRSTGVVRWVSSSRRCLLASRRQNADTSKVFQEKKLEYQKAVSALRKQYAQEVEKEKQSQQREEEEARQAQIRKRLERQRRKHVRAAYHAQLEKEKREARALEHVEEVKVSQANLQKRKDRMKKAQALLIEELEEEAPYWLTTEEEVEEMFSNKDVEQQLWTHPGGCIGAPRPVEDAEFWKYVSHTWDMGRTYPSPRDLLLEQLEDQIYKETNVDYENYWTDQRQQASEEIRDKARLRALVRDQGRRSLLQKQRQMLQDQFAKASEENNNLPKAMPAPKLQVLANTEAMEEEGVHILNENMSKFIEPDNQKPVVETDFYPTFLGRLPRPDTRTEKEKKRDAREEKLLAAAAAKDAIEFAAEESLADGRDPLNYNELGNQKDEEDIFWERGVDDEELLALPSHQRYTPDDMEWVASQLELRMSKLQEIYKMEKSTKLISTDDSPSSEQDSEKSADDNDDESTIDLQKWDREFELINMYQQHESLLSSLSPSQTQALQDIPTTNDKSTLKSALEKVPGLTSQQIDELVDLELSLSKNDDFLNDN